MLHFAYKSLLVLIIYWAAVAINCTAIAQKLFFNSWNTEAGLSRNSIFSICQDQTGYIWIGTGKGLNRFDGKEFKVYFPQGKETSPGENDINALSVDKDNRLWIGMGKGLAVYDISKNEFSQVHINNDTTKQFVVYCLVSDEHSNLWVGTSRGLFRIPGKGPRVLEKFRLNDAGNTTNEAVRCLFIDKEKQLWAGTSSGITKIRFVKGVAQYKKYQYDPQNPKSLSSNIVTTITEDIYNNIWIGTRSKGINLLNKASDDFIHLSTSSENQKLASDYIRVI
ncbi:MAG: two-component regulator propeller domain-containing protein, partial [Niabella sp.]